MKTLIVLTSPPACGKTTWAHNFAKEHMNTFVVSLNDIKKEVTGKIDLSDNNPIVWDTFDARIKEYASKDVENLVVIADASFYLNNDRTEIVKRHPEFDRFVLVIFTCLLEESLENNKNRDENLVISDQDLIKEWEKFEKPSVETIEFYDEFIRVIGNYKHTKVHK